MAARPKAPRLNAGERDTIVAFLADQLGWLDREILDYSRQPAVADLRIIGQMEYFKNYRSAVRHLMATAVARGPKPRRPK